MAGMLQSVLATCKYPSSRTPRRAGEGATMKTAADDDHRGNMDTASIEGEREHNVDDVDNDADNDTEEEEEEEEEDMPDVQLTIDQI